MVRFFATSLCSFLVLLPALASAQLPNLMGSVALPPEGIPGQSVPVTLMVRNGVEISDAPGTFQVEIWFSPDDVLETTGNDADELIFEQRITLDATNCASGPTGYPPGCRFPQGPADGGPAAPIAVKLPDDLEGDSGFAILVIDALDEVAETNENDNIFVSPRKINLLRPDVTLRDRDNRPEVTFEHGTCYFGEGATITYSLRNMGKVDAWAFLDDFILSTDAEVQKPETGGKDVVFDSVPKQCADGATAACGPGEFCGHGVCKKYCSTNDDCPSNFICEPDKESAWFVGKTCQLYQAAGAPPSIHTRDIVLPTLGNDGRLLPEQDYFILVANVASPVYPDGDLTNNNSWGQVEPFFCQHPRPDFEIGDLIIPARVAAGETATIVRKISNLGIRAGETKYRYVLSHNEFPTRHDLILPIESASGGRITMEETSAVEGADLVRLPSFVKPGKYYIGIVLDPDDEVSELDETNNVLISSQMVQVDPPSLAVVTRNLADATVRQNYTADLVAVGGVAAHVWSADRLPPGMSLSSDGKLSGAPLEPGRFDFRVTVRSGDVSVTETLVLRVFPPMGPLAITTQRLPPAVMKAPYSARIDAQGGMPPYTCTVFQAGTGEGGIPTGLTLNEDCTIDGNATIVGEYPFAIRLSDTLGNSLTAEYTLKVVEASNLNIETQRLNQATAGQYYGQNELDCVTARGGDGNYEWRVEPTSNRHPPEGLSWTDATVDKNQRPSLCFRGEPTECGEFLIPVRVTDGNGQSDFADIPLNVLCSSVRLITTSIDPIRVGSQVNAVIQFEAGDGGTIEVATGALPPGLTLDPAGNLTGTVDRNAQPGTYSAMLKMTDGAAGRGMDAFTVVVLPALEELPSRPDIVTEEGCSATGGGPVGLLPYAVALLGLFALGLRRRLAPAEARITDDRS